AILLSGGDSVKGRCSSTPGPEGSKRVQRPCSDLTMRLVSGAAAPREIVAGALHLDLRSRRRDQLHGLADLRGRAERIARAENEHGRRPHPPPPPAPPPLPPPPPTEP